MKITSIGSDRELISAVIERHDFGGVESSEDAPVTYTAFTEEAIHTYSSGPGYLYHVRFVVLVGINSDQITPYFKLDETKIRPSSQFAVLNTYGYDKDTVPLKLHVYSVNGLCVCAWDYNPPLYFDFKLEFCYKNPSANTRSGNLQYFYTKI